jgi:hypothetical protein
LSPPSARKDSRVVDLGLAQNAIVAKGRADVAIFQEPELRLRGIEGFLGRDRPYLPRAGENFARGAFASEGLMD